MWRHWNLEPGSFDVKRKVAVRERVLAGGRGRDGRVRRVRSTIQLATAGVGSSVISASVATTEKVWVPSARGPGTSTGESHGIGKVPSSEHVNVSSPGSFELPRVALVWFVLPAGAA